MSTELTTSEEEIGIECKIPQEISRSSQSIHSCARMLVLVFAFEWLTSRLTTDQLDRPKPPPRAEQAIVSTQLSSLAAASLFDLYYDHSKAGIEPNIVPMLIHDGRPLQSRFELVYVHLRTCNIGLRRALISI